MADFYYFTDASIVVQHNAVAKKGAFGFVVFSKTNLIQNSFVGYSYPDINYLECLGIAAALSDISYQSNENTYTIYTDSRNAYMRLKECLENENVPWKEKANEDIFLYEVMRTTNLINHLISLNFNLSVYCIKGHCGDVKIQRNYLVKQGATFTKEDIKFMCRGNFLVDKLVNNTATFTDAYSIIPYTEKNNY